MHSGHMSVQTILAHVLSQTKLASVDKGVGEVLALDVFDEVLAIGTCHMIA